jgi:hypothetical protein
MTDRTAAALASALPAGIRYFVDLDLHKQRIWRAQEIADFQAERLAESGWRLVHADDPVRKIGNAEHTAEALARVLDPDQVHDHVEASDE